VVVYGDAASIEGEGSADVFLVAPPDHMLPIVRLEGRLCHIRSPCATRSVIAFHDASVSRDPPLFIEIHWL
jgi:hypothetical protein